MPSSTRRTLSAAGVVALTLAALCSAPSAQAIASSSTIVTTTADAGPGSLRAAISEANIGVPGFRIAFGVTGTIQVDSPLPAITNSVTIDGSTLVTLATPSAPTIELDFNGNTGLVFGPGADESKLLDLSLVNASGSAVTIGADRVLVAGNWIGVTPAGVAAGNGGDGITLEPGTMGNRIGENDAGVSGAVSNVISANGGSGIRLEGSTENIIRANRVGTNPAGTAAMANSAGGITLTAKSSGNTIGGRVYTDSATGQSNNPTGSEGSVDPTFVVPPLGNLVSGNDAHGIAIQGQSDSNVLNGNFVGTTADGNSSLPNDGDGVLIEDSDFTLLQGCRLNDNPFVYYNVLSGNTGNGLHLRSADSTLVQANFFGVGANNTDLVPNGKDGLLIDGDSQTTQVGGVIPMGNVVAGNTGNGIAVRDTASGFISFNTFGGLLAFKGAAPNGKNGILITSTGGDQSIRTSVLSGNKGNGLKLAGAATGVTAVPDIIGLDTRGTGKLPNGKNGILITGRAHGNTIGGAKASVIRQNTVSGNKGYGLVINGKAHHNNVFRTFLGANIQGVHLGKKLPRVGNAKGGVLVAGTAHHNVFGYARENKMSKMISGNEGPGITLKGKTSRNHVVRNFIGVGRHGKCLVNRGPNVIDRGNNIVKGNVECGPGKKDNDLLETPSRRGRG